MRLSAMSSVTVLIGAFFFVRLAEAEKPPDPDVAYIYPPGAQRGKTVDVHLAGFDWTPDLEFYQFDPRATLTVDGSLSRHLMPEPPFPVGMRAYRPPYLPREINAKLVLPADLPPGPIRWQVANANGASNTGVFMVGEGAEILEERDGANPQRIDCLPVTVSGRLSRYEEVDSYLIETDRDDLITCNLWARRLGSNFNGVLEVRDASNRVVSDAVDSQGMDVDLTFAAKAGQQYRIFIRDLNFRGNRAYVYRLGLSKGPRILAAVPAAGRRGETRDVEFIGYGLASGRCEIERVTRSIHFPDDPEKTSFESETTLVAGATTRFTYPLSDVPEVAISKAPLDSTVPMQLPIALTGALDRDHPAERFRLSGKQGDIWNILVQSRRIGSPLDVSVSIVGPDGKEAAANDDLPGTTDAGVEFLVPADGTYTLIVNEVSGAHPSPLNLYRLIMRPGEPDFELQVAQHLNIPIGGKIELPVKVNRMGGFAGPINLTIQGLPEGVRSPPGMVINGDQKEFKISLESVADAPSGSSVASILGTAQSGSRAISHQAVALAAGNLAARSPDELIERSLLMASTMKPVVKIRPIETDERTVHRGTVHLAELSIERTAEFNGEVIVQMDSRQPNKFRQGILGPDVIVPRGSDRVFFPCLVPEFAETQDAYRILLVAIAQVPDSRGRVRHLLSKMQADDASVAITVEGALLKISTETSRAAIDGSGRVQIPVKVARSSKLPLSVRLDLRSQPDGFHAEPVFVAPGQTEALMTVVAESRSRNRDECRLTIRATALQPGTPPTISESNNVSPMDPDIVAVLKSGALPVVADTTVLIEPDATVLATPR